MNDQLRVQVEIMLPQWYVEKHGLTHPAVGGLEIAWPDPADGSIEPLAHILMGKMRGDLCDWLRIRENGG